MNTLNMTELEGTKRSESFNVGRPREGSRLNHFELC